MSIRKDKLTRKEVKRNVNDQCRQYLVAMLDSPFLERLRMAIVILFRIGYKDLIRGNDGTKQSAA